MRALVVFLLAALGCSPAEGRDVTRCELRDQLKAAIPDKAEYEGLSVDVLVAHIVCHAQFASGFNTSAVNQLDPKSNTVRTPPPTTPKPPHVDANIWTLYGLFQLSNHLVCSDGESPSPNICGMSCSQLLDEDTDDDISCVSTLFLYAIAEDSGYEYQDDLMTMVRLIYQQECRTITVSEYFTDCPSDT
ncbi:lysozyme C, milk isozyme-like [Sparus aurata]|uniref:lysozyme C, milk isozyme-like n=1 Tax=Sparus aurata TaxID=8175 RepID=UPI0011C0D809|nr:lysozyme C, milk isozyme-like [Sparus aurata]